MTEEYTEEQLYALGEFLGTLDVHATHNINNRVPALSSDVELKKLSSKGFNLTGLSIVGVKSWFGFSLLIVLFEKNKPSLISIEPKQH